MEKRYELDMFSLSLSAYHFQFFVAGDDNRNYFIIESFCADAVRHKEMHLNERKLNGKKKKDKKEFVSIKFHPAAPILSVPLKTVFRFKSTDLFVLNIF